MHMFTSTHLVCHHVAAYVAHDDCELELEPDERPAPKKQNKMMKKITQTPN